MPTFEEELLLLKNKMLLGIISALDFLLTCFPEYDESSAIIFASIALDP